MKSIPINSIPKSNQHYYKKKTQKDFFVLGQIVESANPPEGISTYVLKENDVKMAKI